MSAIRTPFDDIGAVSTGITWSTTHTTGSAPLPPAAPGTYNGTLNFTGVAPGSYTYTATVSVTVGSDTCEHVVDITYDLTQHLPVVNDDCVDASVMLFPYGACFTLEQETILEECPGIDQADFDSSIAKPAAWGSFTYNADVWYKFSYDPSNNPGGVAPINMAINVDGSPYGAEGIQYPALAIYSDCDASDLVIASVSNTQSKTINLTGIFASSFTYYIRVSAPQGNEGKFDISITT